MKLSAPIVFPDGTQQSTAMAATNAVEFTSQLMPQISPSASTETVAAFAIKAGRGRFLNPIRASACTFEVATAAGAMSSVQFGIYDSGRNLIVQSGPLDASSTGRKTFTFPERVFPIGDYYFAWTFSTNTGAMRCAGISSGISFYNDVTQFFGIVGGTASMLSMPLSIGNFTSAGFIGGFPLCFIYKT